MAGFIELACKLNNEDAFRELAKHQPLYRNELAKGHTLPTDYLEMN